jgi:VanZ family protein
MRSVFLVRPDAAELRRYSDGWWGKVRVWWPVAVALIVIAIESTNTFSSENTSGWIRPVVERIFGQINDQLWAAIHHLMRKSGHFTGYGGLALTQLRAWLLTLGLRDGPPLRDRLTLRGWRWRATWMAVVGTAFVAGLDEWHQTFIPSRTGAFSDVVLDTVGGSVLCGMIWVLCGWWRKAKA